MGTISVRCEKCGTLRPQGTRCKECAKQYDKNRQSRTRFYHHRAWQEMRKKVIDFYCGCDLWILGLTGKLAPCERPTVHHIKEYRKNPELALDFENLVPLGSTSHNTVHEYYDTGHRDEAEEILNKGKARFREMFQGRNLRGVSNE